MDHSRDFGLFHLAENEDENPPESENVKKSADKLMKQQKTAAPWLRKLL